MSQIRGPGKWAAAWACVMFAFVLSAAGARAQNPSQVRFTGKVDQGQVTVGDPFNFVLQLEYAGRQLNQNPTTPDFGELTVSAGPGYSSQVYSDNRGVRFILSWQWQLTAEKEGRFTIGPAQIVIDGQPYQTQPVTINATRQAAVAAPTDLKDAVLSNARTGDPTINQQLQGKLFMTAQASNARPYTGEPVVVKYTLYLDRVDLASLGQEAPTDIPGAVSEELFNASKIEFHNVTLSGRPYRAAEVYRIAVVPNQPGQLKVEGYAMNGRLKVQGRRGDSFSDPFDVFNDPFFGGGVGFQIPSPPVVLDVQPLPTMGVPPGFNGTIGEYSVDAKVDKPEASEDELITYRIVLEGHGAIDQASAPQLPAQMDFEVIGETPQVEKQADGDRVGGKKTFEYVLRPRRAGRLEIPKISYPIFDPWAGRYQTLETPGVVVAVGPGRGSAAGTFDQADAPVAATGARPQLQHLKSISDFQLRRAPTLFESPLVWLPQVALAGMLTMAWRRDRRRAQFDPAQARRGAAWRTFEKRMKHFRQLAASAKSIEDWAGAAAALEQAARGLIADKFNQSADGLTRRDIEALLVGAQMKEERAVRLLDLLDGCATIRYAPVATAGGEVRRWGDEVGEILREGLR